MYYILCITLAVLCAVIGLIGVGLVGYELLGLLGLRENPRRRLRLAGLLFALPAGMIGAWIGYQIGANLGF